MVERRKLGLENKEHFSPFDLRHYAFGLEGFP